MRRALSFTIDACREAVAAANANRLRTGLAALATSAAVATIIIVVTGLDGVARYAQETGARAFGSDTFVITQLVPSQLSRKELAERLARNPPIRAADTRFLNRVAEQRVTYAPTAQRGGDVAFGNRRFENAAISGTAETLPDIRIIEIGDGRFFTRAEAARDAQVVVLGADIAETLFGGGNAVGKRVRIAGRGFDVVGVVVRQGQAGGVTLDRYAYIPLGAFERTFGAATSLQVFARAPDNGTALAAGTQALRTSAAEDHAYVSMRARRQLAPGEPDTFDVITPEASRAFVLQLAQRIGAGAVPISLIALVTAVIVVTNTVLVSVTQRIREIGIRRAVGAPRAQIMAEVLAESLLTACLGGVAGITIAMALLFTAGQLLDIPLQTAWSTIVAAFAAAAATGLAAGYFPALKASRIDIINALRLE